MAVKIKLKRMGKIRTPHYRIIVADSRTRRDGRAIEEIGLYNPKLEPSLIKVDSERAQYWLGVGAQPTDPVMAILKVTGDWQKFKGLPGAEGTLKVADPKAEKRAAFDAALAEVHGEPKDDAATKKSAAKKSTAKKTTAKKSTAKKTTAKKSADSADAKADEAADTKAADSKAADSKAADSKAADTKAADTKAADTKAEAAKAEAAKAADTKAEAADDAAATATDDAAAAKDEA